MEDDSDESILVDLYEDEDDDASIHHGSEDESDDVSIDTRTIGLGAAGPSVPPYISNQLSASAIPRNIQKQLRDWKMQHNDEAPRSATRLNFKGAAETPFSCPKP
jgi:hypothetical protein